MKPIRLLKQCLDNLKHEWKMHSDPDYELEYLAKAYARNVKQGDVFEVCVQRLWKNHNLRIQYHEAKQSLYAALILLGD